jgi:hypothetical protein
MHGKRHFRYKTLQFKFLKREGHFEDMIGDILTVKLKEIDCKPTYVD